MLAFLAPLRLRKTWRQQWLSMQPRAISPRVATRFVVFGTLALTIAAIGYIVRFAANMPNTDEWDFANVVAGMPSLSWILEHHNEHRYPLARFLWCTSVYIVGDFRAPMFLFAVVMGIASGLLVDVARRLRGHLSLGDLVIPAILLHWGHAFNFLMGYQLAFGLFVLGFAGVGWGIVARRLHVAGLFALVAVQSGGFGLAVTVPFACVFLAAGIRTRPSLLVWPIAILAYSGWVAMTMPPSTGVSGKPGLFAGTACYLSIGVGPVVAQLGRTAWLLIGGAIACAGVAAMFCLRYWDRRIAIGLLFWFVAFGASALAVGYGRGEWALGYRFVTVSAIGLAMVWCVLGRWLGGSGIVLAIVIFGVNTRHAVWYGKLCRHQIRQFEEDVKQSNLSPVFLAGKHGNAFHIMRGSGLPVIATLRDTVWSNRFAHIPNDPHFTLVAAKGALPANIVCRNESFLPGGPPVPSVSFDANSNPVVGLRLHGEQLCHIVHQRLRLRWLDASGTERTAEVVPAVMPGVFTVTFPMTGIVSNVQLEPATWSAGLVVSTAEWLVEN